jgi:hypothetical protein
MSVDLAEWSRRLRTIAEPVLAETPLVRPATRAEKQAFADTFTDEAGHRRVWDAFLLARLLGLPTPQSDEPWLWSWSSLPLPEGGARGGFASTPPPRGRGLGGGFAFEPQSPPFFADPHAWTLEQETEKELAGLHGWSWLLRSTTAGDATTRDATVRERSSFDAATDWILANIQPDNATNHPWAIHVFLARAAAGHTDARLYAETMLHNTLVHHARPDRFSALILLDAADWLA